MAAGTLAEAASAAQYASVTKFCGLDVAVKVAATAEVEVNRLVSLVV